MEKYERYLKVSEYMDDKSYRTNKAPYIRMIGYWLREAGFDIGEYIRVNVEEGRLIITKDGLEDRINGDNSVE